jgi:hypothetical protein
VITGPYDTGKNKRLIYDRLMICKARLCFPKGIPTPSPHPLSKKFRKTEKKKTKK